MSTRPARTAVALCRGFGDTHDQLYDVGVA